MISAVTSPLSEAVLPSTAPLVSSLSVNTMLSLQNGDDPHAIVKSAATPSSTPSNNAARIICSTNIISRATYPISQPHSGHKFIIPQRYSCVTNKKTCTERDSPCPALTFISSFESLKRQTSCHGCPVAAGPGTGSRGLPHRQPRPLRARQGDRDRHQYLAERDVDELSASTTCSPRSSRMAIDLRFILSGSSRSTATSSASATSARTSRNVPRSSPESRTSSFPLTFPTWATRSSS